METSEGDPKAGAPRIEAVDRALVLLEELAAFGHEGASLARLSEGTGISKPTAYRALATMRARGFVGQGADGSYRLGPKALMLADRFMSDDNLRAALHDVLGALSRRVEELVHLGTWDGNEVVYIDKIEPESRAIRVWSSVGQRVPAASTSLGRALLAAENRTREELEMFVEIAPADRQVSLDRLVEAIEETRRTGFSSEIEENEPGVACMGFALMRAGRPVAAISITALASRLTESRRVELQELIARELPGMLPESLSLYRPPKS